MSKRMSSVSQQDIADHRDAVRKYLEEAIASGESGVSTEDLDNLDSHKSDSALLEAFLASEHLVLIFKELYKRVPEASFVYCLMETLVKEPDLFRVKQLDNLLKRVKGIQQSVSKTELIRTFYYAAKRSALDPDVYDAELSEEQKTEIAELTVHTVFSLNSRLQQGDLPSKKRRRLEGRLGVFVSNPKFPEVAARPYYVRRFGVFSQVSQAEQARSDQNSFDCET